MRPGGENRERKGERERGGGKERNNHKLIGCVASKERKREEERGKQRATRLFVDIINHCSGVGTSLRATVTRRVRPARKFVDMQNSFSASIASSHAAAAAGLSSPSSSFFLFPP